MTNDHDTAEYIIIATNIYTCPGFISLTTKYLSVIEQSWLYKKYNFTEKNIVMKKDLIPIYGLQAKSVSDFIVSQTSTIR